MLGSAEQTMSHKAPSLWCEMQILITLSVPSRAFSVACISRSQKYLYSIHFCRTFHPTDSQSASQTERSTLCGDRFAQRRNAAAVQLHMAIPQTLVCQGMAPSCVRREQRETSPNAIAEAEIWCQHPEQGAEQRCCVNVLQAGLKFCR